MARIAEPGIDFYKLKCSHIRNKKIKLLYNDHGPVGYWIWQCIISYAYEEKGYYFDLNDSEFIELFASDTCKQPLQTIENVIKSCINRKLFDKDIFEQYNILTGEIMQDIYLTATTERRRKGTVVEMIQEFILVKIPESERKILIVPRNNSIPPRNNEENPRNNPQSKVEYSKGEESKGYTAPNGTAGADAPGSMDEKDKKAREEYDQLAKTKTLICKFIKERSPRFINPYYDLWNVFAEEKKKPVLKTITKKRIGHLNARLKEKSFDFLSILKIAGTSDLLLTSSWFSFDWIIKNQEGYIKVLEGNYNNQAASQNGTAVVNKNGIASAIYAARESELMQ